VKTARRGSVQGIGVIRHIVLGCRGVGERGLKAFVVLSDHKKILIGLERKRKEQNHHVTGKKEKAVAKTEWRHPERHGTRGYHGRG